VRERTWLVLDLGLKVLLVGLLAFGAFSGLQQFEGKAFGWRLLTYPLSAILVPAVWHFAGRPKPYPYAIDMLVVAPFLVDVLGNTFDLYDSVDWWDDANHFVNWALLSLAVGLLLLRLGVGPWTALVLVTGVGATLAILWELAEYFAFIRGGSEESTAYTDTLGDEVLGLSGSIVAGLVTAAVARRRRSVGPSPSS
jgi:uncharacterized membrane protein YjdF